MINKYIRIKKLKNLEMIQNLLIKCKTMKIFYNNKIIKCVIKKLLILYYILLLIKIIIIN